MSETREEEKGLMECQTDGQSALPTQGASSTPVQVVKPTPRLDKDTSATGASSPSDGFNFASIGLSTKPNHNNNSNNANKNNNSGEQVGDNNNEDGRMQVGETLEAEEEPDFEWNDYLESTGSIAAPPILFPHVESSLQTLFTEGMKLEVPNKFIEGTYWVAVIVTPCGPLLRLRYEGYDACERSDDFWCEIVSGDIRPIGWCATNGFKMEPPPNVLKKWGNNWVAKLMDSLNDVVTIPSYLLESTGCTTIDQIKQGMKFEVQDELDLTHVWIATVMENVGGRMLLRYDGIHTNTHDFWLFYSSFRVHYFGWARGNECTYKPPTVLLPLKSVQEWANILNESMSAACKMTVPPVIFKTQELVMPHEFKEGMKLEALDPISRTRICVASVAKVLNRYYFTVQFDQSVSVATNSTSVPPVMCCHSRTPIIFPPGWAKSNLLEIEFWDRGNSSDEFDWKEYVIQSNKGSNIEIQLAPLELFKSSTLQTEEQCFEIGMKLEAVNPFHPNQISVATVCKVSGNLIWIQLDNSTILFPNHVVACNSHDIFPVGWCDSNGYPLKVPSICQQNAQKTPAKKVAIVIPKKQQSKVEGKDEDSELVKESETTGRAWCPVIYVNHKCFTGPFLSISRIAGLSKQVGPGPIHLVLKEVISMIVGVSYLPSRCLSVLQSDEDEHEPGMHQQLIKAKYKGRKYKAMVDIVSNSEKVREYCRSVCKKLQCCTNLFGPDCYTDNCPENCYSLTKSNPNQTIKRKKRRKKPKSFLVKNGETSKPATDEHAKEEDKPVLEKVIQMEESNHCDEDEKVENDDDSCEPPKEKRKYVHRTITKSEIVTRGAKLPDFGPGLGKRKFKNIQSKMMDVDKQNGSKDNLKPVTASATLATKDSADSENVDLKFTSKDSFDDSLSLMADANASSDEEHFQQSNYHLDSNPLQWSIEQVSLFIKNTDCAPMARLLKEQEIDGQALLLLTLPTIQEHLELKLGPAIKLSNHIEQLKSAFYSQYGN